MSITYEYQVANLDVANIGGNDDAVVAIHYRVIASKEGSDTSPVQSGVVELTQSDSFTPFDDLTKDQVTEWLKASIDVESIEADLEAQLGVVVIEPVATTSKIPVW